MRKRNLSILKMLCMIACAMVMLLGMGKLDAYAEELSYLPYEGASYDLIYEIGETGITITGYTGTVEGELIMPDEIDGVSVIGIADYAFQRCYSLTGTLVIPDSITSIGKWAFNNCNKLQEVQFGNGVVTINSSAFANCYGLKSISLGKSVQEFKDAFGACTKLESVAVDADNEIYKSIDNVVFSKDGTVIEFSPCARIGAEYVVPEGVTVVAESAFEDSNNLVSVTMPDSLTKIEKYAFQSCDKLSEIVIGAGTVEIGKATFGGCTELVTITVDSENPNFVAKDSVVFSKDETGIVVYAPGKSDWSYSIPEGITTIYSGAFWACDNLHRITVPGSVNFIDEVAFGNVPSRQPEQIIFEGNPPDMSYKAFGSLIISGSEYWRTIYYPAQNANWESWLVSNESNWNNYCIDFKSYTDVNDISTEMASGSYGDLEWCLKLDGELYITGKGDMEEASSSSSYPWSIYRSDIKRVVIGDEVTSIAKSAFESYNIIELVLGESVKSIGEKAFAYCENLKGNLLLPNSVESVGYMAFWYSGFDGNLVLPENIAEIGSGAFGYSNFTGNLIIPNTIQKIEIGAFQNCSGFTGDLIIPDSVTEIGRMAFGYCGFDGKIVLPDGLEIIDEYVFDGCDKLSGELVLPKTVKSIGWCAFFGCSSFTGDLIIPESVTMIDGGAFYGCSGFSGKLVVPESVSSVGENAFRGCTGLEGQVYISEHLASAEPTAFELLYEVDMDKPDDEEEAASTRGEVTVYAPKGSYAEEYANTNGYMYVEWDGTEVIVQNPFVDVLEGAFYHDAVLWASDNEITKGYGQENTFCPENTCTRGQIVTFLWRANGSPEPASMNNPFTDVKSSDYYYKAVLWAVENGITAGYGSDTIFNPDGACTRGQVATFLWRAEGKPGMSHATNPFTDVKPGEFYYDAVLWAVENGITNGYGSDTIFNPDGVCTRGQIVTFLYRAMK